MRGDSQNRVQHVHTSTSESGMREDASRWSCRRKGASAKGEYMISKEAEKGVATLWAWIGQGAGQMMR